MGGIISASSRKNTVSESRMEMESETFSPESKLGINIRIVM